MVRTLLSDENSFIVAFVLTVVVDAYLVYRFATLPIWPPIETFTVLDSLWYHARLMAWVVLFVLPSYYAVVAGMIVSNAIVYALSSVYYKVKP